MYLVNKYTSERQEITAEKAIELYLTFVNDYLCYRTMAADMLVTSSTLRQVLDCGKMLYEVYDLHTFKQSNVE